MSAVVLWNTTLQRGTHPWAKSFSGRNLSKNSQIIKWQKSPFCRINSPCTQTIGIASRYYNHPLVLLQAELSFLPEKTSPRSPLPRFPSDRHRNQYAQNRISIWQTGHLQMWESCTKERKLKEYDFMNITSRRVPPSWQTWHDLTPSVTIG